MNVLEYVIDFSKSYGEDRLAITEDLVCAIDGSSPIKQIAVLPFHSQAEWLASAVAGAVSLCTNGTIPEYAQMAVDSINFRYAEMLENFPDEMKPCAVLAGVCKSLAINYTLMRLVIVQLSLKKQMVRLKS